MLPKLALPKLALPKLDMSLISNNYKLICGLALVYVLYEIGRQHNSVETFSNEKTDKIHPSKIGDALQELKAVNTVLKDDMLLDKYRDKYEDYLIELYQYVNLSALQECIKPDSDINNKMRALKKLDARYDPLKVMINASMKTLNETKKK